MRRGIVLMVVALGAPGVMSCQTNVKAYDWCIGDGAWGTATAKTWEPTIFGGRRYYTDEFLVRCGKPDWAIKWGHDVLYWIPVMTLDEFAAIARGEEVTIGQLPERPPIPCDYNPDDPCGGGWR